MLLFRFCTNVFLKKRPFPPLSENQGVLERLCGPDKVIKHWEQTRGRGAVFSIMHSVKVSRFIAQGLSSLGQEVKSVGRTIL